MSKAIVGAVEIGVAVGLIALTIVEPELLANPTYDKIAAGLIVSGIGSEVGAIADALTSNRGQGITTRQPAQFRQIVYGEQRVAGNIVYLSSTGSHHDQYNMVIVVAGHEIDCFENLYLDGRQVFWNPNSASGYTVRNGVGFGGGGDGQPHIGPNGVVYQFNDGDSGHEGVYCQARFGDQLPGDVISSLTANDPTWTGVNGQTPYLGGCAYVYLKLEYDTTVFPNFPPEIKFTIRGKNDILDPRTGAKGYTNNPALILADILQDPRYGLNDATVNVDQLIAAANICDEQVACAAGTEARYTCNHHYDTSTGIGDVLQTVLNTMGARLSRISGEWYIFPATYLAPTLSFTANDLMGPVQWEPTGSYRDLFNRVRGTYTAANYPYNATSATGSNLYDSNGWYANQIQNNFPYEWQPDNFPEYACDPLHGYAADQYLNEDGGQTLVREFGLPAVLSVSQAQRLAKIMLLRNRQQGSGKLTMSLAGLQLQPCDTFTLTVPAQGWENKLLEVTSVELSMKGGGGTGQAPQFVVTVGVQEVDPSVYEWSTTEELTPYQVPAVPTQVPYTVAPPTDMSVDSLVFAQPDGTLLRMLEVTWDTPMDTRVSSIQCQFQIAGSATWWDGGTVSAQSNALLLNSIVSGQTYNVRIASVRPNGAMSTWVEADGVATTSLSPVVYQGAGVANSALSVSGSTVSIAPISTTLGSTPVSYYPQGASVSGITPGQTNYVYVVDPTYAGGTPSPVITTNQSDYLGRVGYVLLGTVS